MRFRQYQTKSCARGQRLSKSDPRAQILIYNVYQWFDVTMADLSLQQKPKVYKASL